MRAYKVVMNVRGRLLSANNPYGRDVVEYIPNSFVGPTMEHSYLFCFKKEADAIQFSKLNSDMEVWECEILETTSKGIFAFTWNQQFLWEKMSKLLKSKKSTHSIKEYTTDTDAEVRYANKTIWAKRVKLTKRLK